MVVLGCLGLLKKKGKLGNDSVNKTTKEEDEHAIVAYNFLGLYCCGYHKNKLSMIDVKSTRVREVRGLEVALRGDNFSVGNSCNGLILLKSYSFCDRYCVIFNPKSNKVVKRITPPVWLSFGVAVALFYHPLAKEYRTLNVTGAGKNRYEYHIYQFGSDSWRAALNPYFHFTPSEQRPTCTKQALFWCCKTIDSHIIMVFDIMSEEFCLKPLPVCCMGEELYTPPTLVAKNNEDRLCCCYANHAEFSIDVWVLEDYENWSWNRKYVVDLDWRKTDRYSSVAWRAYTADVMGSVRVVSIQKDELVFFYRGDDDKRSIYSCHLVSGLSVRTKLSKTFWKNILRTVWLMAGMMNGTCPCFVVLLACSSW